MKISLEGKILFAVQFIDCGMTCHGIQSGIAKEFNPIMRFFLDRNLLSFVVVKIVTVLVLVFFLEFLRYRQSEDIKTIKRLQWIGILQTPVLILLRNLFYGRIGV